MELVTRPEEESQGSGHQRGVVVHGQVKQDPEERLATVTVKVQHFTAGGEVIGRPSVTVVATEDPLSLSR